ncbi:MAG TPA: hypothetical protein VFT95_01205, partial [Micromonosporaceae bacterium]|nr:hypothetical protein [Micromonosporaceae bacterium]
MDSDPGSPRAGLRTSLEAVGAVGGGLLVLGTLAGLLGVTGWLAVALVILGGLGVAVAVGRWTSSRLQSLAGASLAL